MARKATINKAERVYKNAVKMKAKREEWKAIVSDPQKSVEERRIAMDKLAVTRSASMVRVQRRCNVNGRGRGVFRRYGMCRNVIRKLLMDGMFPGSQKASW